MLYDKRGRSDGRGNVVVYLGLISTFNDGADPNHDGLTNEYDDVFFTTENVKTGGNDDLVSANFTNNRANNVITDNGGNDCVEGGPGNDTFIQGTAPQGADVILGDTGTDTADYSGRTDAVAVSLDGVANDGDIATNEGDMVGGLSVSCRPATVIVNPPVGIFIDIFGDASILTASVDELHLPGRSDSGTGAELQFSSTSSAPARSTRAPQGIDLRSSATAGSRSAVIALRRRRRRERQRGCRQRHPQRQRRRQRPQRQRRQRPDRW